MLPTVHPFLGYPWFVKGSDRGIAWGVLTTTSIMDLLRLVRGQDVEEEIECPGYLIGATGEGAAMLRPKPDDPIPLRQLILLNRNDNIRPWFLANKGHNPLDLMVLESHGEAREDLDETLETTNGRYLLFDRDVWDESAGEDSVSEMPHEGSVDDEEWLEAEPAGETRAPHGAGVIYVDDGDVSIESASSFINVYPSHENEIANYGRISRYLEIRAPQHAGRIFHRKSKYRQALIQLRRRQGWRNFEHFAKWRRSTRGCLIGWQTQELYR